MADQGMEFFRELNEQAKRIRAEKERVKAAEELRDALDAAFDKYKSVLEESRYQYMVEWGGLDLSLAFKELWKIKNGFFSISQLDKLLKTQHIMSLFRLDANYVGDFVKVKGLFKGSEAYHLAGVIAHDRQKRNARDRADAVREMQSYLRLNIAEYLYYDHDDPAHGHKKGEFEESRLFRYFFDQIAIATDANVYKKGIDEFLKTGKWGTALKPGHDAYTHQDYPDIYTREKDKFKDSIMFEDDEPIKEEQVISDEEFNKIYDKNRFR